MPGLFKPTYSDLDPKTGKRVRRKTAKWYGWFRAANGKTVRVPLSTDKAAAQAMLAKLLSNLEKGKAGLVDEFAEHRHRLIADHLAEYAAVLRHRGITARQIEESTARIRTVIELAGIKTTADLLPVRVQTALAQIRDRGRSVQTVNGYLGSMKAFAQWMLLDKRIETNPFIALKAGNTKVDRRHDRRALLLEEVNRLIQAAAESGDVEGLIGLDRAWLYRLAAYSGLRCAELASLTPASFKLNGEMPTVRVLAAYSKRRQTDVVPLHPSLIEPLREWLRGKTPDQPLWPGKWAKLRRGAKMMRHDLLTAGIPYRDPEGKFADFHSLRATFITWLARSGVHPSVAQRLARHSTIRLTMDVYTKVGEPELVQGIAALPPLAG